MMMPEDVATAMQDLEVLESMIQRQECELATLKRLQESLTLEIHAFNKNQQAQHGSQPGAVKYPDG